MKELFMKRSQYLVHCEVSLYRIGCLPLQQQQHIPMNAVKRKIPDVSTIDLAGCR